MRKHPHTWGLRYQDKEILLTFREQTSFPQCVPRTKRPRRSHRVSQRQRIDDTSSRRLIAHADEIVVILGADGVTRYQSPAAERLLGYAAKDTMGMNGFNFVHSDDRPHLLATFAALLDQPGSSCAATVRVLHSDGSWRSLEVVATNLLHDAAVAGIILKCHSVTELTAAKKSEEETAHDAEWQRAALAQHLERQQQWVSDVTHELKSPLAAIRARLEVAALHPEHTDWRMIVSEMLDEVALMRRLIDEIHDLAFIDERGVVADVGPRRKVDLNALIVTEARKVSDRRVQTEQRAAAWVRGNPDHFRRVVRNLLENAARYAQNTIHLAVTTGQNRVVFSIEDDGPGIPASDCERIFHRFSHVERTRGQTRHGPGLGLAIVRTLVSQYGGEVTVSDSPLGGAKFVVTFPAAKEE
jgi:PAS domain S-box-containing protein